MIRKKKYPNLEKLKLNKAQRNSVSRLLTAQKNKYKKLLHETHERLHVIADMTTSLEFWYNVNGACEHVSPACENVTGYRAAEFRKGEMNLETLIHEQYLQKFKSDRSETISGRAVSDNEYRITRKDGESRWVMATWRPVLTRREKQIGIRISLRDITEFKQCQHFSQSYREMILRIGDSLPGIGVFSVSSQGEIMVWNVVMAELLGYEKSEIVGKDFIQVISPDVDIDSMIPDFTTLQNISTEKRETVLRSKSGQDIAAAITFIVLKDAQDQLYRVIFVVKPL